MCARPRLAKASRLLAAVDFTKAMKRGLRTQDGYFTVYAATNLYQRARLGMIVSRKISLKAVIRNRIKRHIRESFRHHLTSLTGLDIVVAAQRRTATSDSQAYRDSLEKHWKLIIQKCVK